MYCLWANIPTSRFSNCIIAAGEKAVMGSNSRVVYVGCVMSSLHGHPWLCKLQEK